MTETGAAHIITTDAVALGDPAVIVTTQADHAGAAEEIERIKVPAVYAHDLDEILRGLSMWGWRVTGELQPTDHDGYWIVDVERDS